MSINEIQDEIIGEISKMNGDVEMILIYIVELGQILPAMPAEFKIEANIIKGCHSKVWLAATIQNDAVQFYADSDTIISKGLVSLLLRIFNHRRPNEILEADLYFIRQNHLQKFIGTKRSNGFAAMIDQMKCCVSNR